MPALTPAEENLIRSGMPVLKYYLAVMPFVRKFQASINQADATWGSFEFAWDGATYGAWGDMENGETVHVYDSTQTTYKGRIRLRYITATTMWVAANNDIEWADDDVFIIYDVWEPWSIPTNQAVIDDVTTYYKDWDIEFTDNATSFPPKSNITQGWAGFLDDSGNADVYFRSRAIPMASGASIASVLWDIGDGTYQSGSSSSTEITARFDSTGFRWVKCTATDDNGKTGVMRVPVWTFGGGYLPIYNLEVRRRSFEVRDGQTDLELFEIPMGSSDIVEGTQVCLFSRQWINGAEVTDDLGSFFPGRRQIRFTGWIIKDTVDWNPEAGSVSFSVGTIGKAADNLPGYGTFLQDVDTAEDWHKLAGLTVRNSLFFLLEWHTNLNQLAYIEYLNSSATDPGPYIGGREFTAAPPLKQLEQAMLKPRGVFVRVGCTRWGSIHFRYDPQELNASDRAYVPQVTHLFRSDRYNELTIGKTTRPRVNSVWGGGIYYDGTDATPYRARSPGKIGREAARRDRADHLIITAQDQLNELLGAYLGELSQPWDPIKPEVAWDIWEPALQESTSVEILDTENPREYAFNSELWIARRLDIKDIQAGTPEITVELELLADPLQGVTVAIPDPPSFPYPEFPPPRPYGPPDDPGLEGKVVIAATDGAGVIWTPDIDQTYPTWYHVGSSLDAETIEAVVQNPANSRELVCLVYGPDVDNEDYGDVYYISDYRSASADWVKIIDGGDAWTSSDADETAHSRTQGNEGYFTRLMITSDGYLLLGLSIETSSANLGAKILRSAGTDWKSAPATYSWGDLVIGNDAFWPRYWRGWNFVEFAAGGSLKLFGENGAGGGREHCSMTSANYGENWTAVGNSINVGGNGGISPRGLLTDGSVVWAQCSWVGSGEWWLDEWPGGDYTAKTEQNSYVIGDFNIANFSFGNHGQCLHNNAGSFYFATALKLNPSELVDDAYGETYIYLGTGWDTAWSTANLDINARSLDNFRSNSLIQPMNRIILGNNTDYSGDQGDKSIYLLTASGTTVANKSGTGLTGVNGLGATKVTGVIWDQYED